MRETTALTPGLILTPALNNTTINRAGAAEVAGILTLPQVGLAAADDLAVLLATGSITGVITFIDGLVGGSILNAGRCLK